MPHELEIVEPTFKDAKWSVAEATPGDKVHLEVTASDLGGAKVFFEVHDALGPIAWAEATQDGPAYKLKDWRVPNTLADANLSFFALLAQEPKPSNGHQAVRKRIQTAAALQVHGYSVAIDPGATDKAFAPVSEQLHLRYRVTYAGAKTLKGRIEVWGEKYPTDKPLYSTNFDLDGMAVNVDRDWNTWDSNATDGLLATAGHGGAPAPITPEFTPYRVRILVGPDQDAVEEPLDAAKGKSIVAIAETGFEVTFESVEIRLQSAVALQGPVTNAVDEALAIEPRNGDGTYPATGRLPRGAPWPAETGRIRTYNMRHNQIADSLNQGFSGPAGNRHHEIADPYIEGGAASKWDIDDPVYVRPELPLEIVPRLRSRTGVTNTTAPFGQLSATAVGPLRIDIHVEDVYPTAHYAGAWTGNVHANFAYRCAHQVKDGAHDAPVENGGNPVITYWQERFLIANDGDRTLNTRVAYVPSGNNAGNNELVIYLNRTKLQRSYPADPARDDYAETNGNCITLRANLTKQDDVVWVQRVPVVNAPTVPVARWRSFPPGDNCHEHHGGIRGADAGGGESRSKLVRSAFTGAVALGHGGNAFPYAALVDLDPDNMVANAERVRARVDPTAGAATQGLAGILFSPSVIGGDSYAVHATILACPYERSLGFLENRETPTLSGAEKVWKKGQTGAMTIWRLCRISTSLKLPNPAGGVAGFADPLVGARAHPADGTAMNVGNLNALMERGYTEWIAPVPVAPTRGGDAHVDINLVTYRGAINGLGGAPLGPIAAIFGPAAGLVNLAINAHVNDEFVRWDHYRVFIPPGVPANRLNLVSNTIAAQPARTSATAACNAADNANTGYNMTPALSWPPLGAGKADQALNGGVALIAQWPAAPGVHDKWVKGVMMELAEALMDTLTPQVNPPPTQAVIRWPQLYQDHWSNGWNTANHGVAGFCRGSGQSFFATVGGNVDTFEHEMGHSLHLAHFVTGSDANTAWKHHDHRYPHCIMGYYNAPGMGLNYTVRGSGVAGAAIHLNTGNRAQFCAKCLMKLRGWKEAVLPCNWAHPDVF